MKLSRAFWTIVAWELGIAFIFCGIACCLESSNLQIAKGNIHLHGSVPTPAANAEWKFQFFDYAVALACILAPALLRTIPGIVLAGCCAASFWFAGWLMFTVFSEYPILPQLYWLLPLLAIPITLTGWWCIEKLVTIIDRIFRSPSPKSFGFPVVPLNRNDRQ
ncbi:MAG TPA: hypothetical protein VIM11_06390 [Tepidisphaeraceae bacterium]|jgi:hypothetical protein